MHRSSPDVLHDIYAFSHRHKLKHTTASNIRLGKQFLDTLHLHLRVQPQFLLLINLQHQLPQFFGVCCPQLVKFLSQQLIF